MSRLRRFRYAVAAVMLGFVPPTIASAQGLGYFTHLFGGQFRLFNRARPVEEVLASPYTDDATRQAIRVIQAAKTFSTAELGLKATKSYREYVALDDPYVVYSVEAAGRLKLETRTWKFPIVGEMPYMGFFSRAKAEAEAARIRAEPEMPDVHVRGVPAYSSLGWFSDLLYSSMIGGDERNLVELTIHESLHATVWIPDQVEFNERLASFVGMQGSLLYLKKKYPGDEQKIVKAKAEVKSDAVFGKFMKEAVAVYKREVEALAEGDSERALKRKAEFYAGLAERYQKFAGADVLPLKFKDWNNAVLLGYANYYTDYSPYERGLAACGGDLKRFAAWLASSFAPAWKAAQKERGAPKSAPEEYLENLAKTGRCG